MPQSYITAAEMEECGDDQALGKMLVSEHANYDGLDSYECAINEFIFNLPELKSWEISGDTIEALGAARRIEKSAVKNPLCDTQEDSVTTLYYDDISVAVYTEKKSNEKFADAIVISKPGYTLKFGIKIGSSKKDIEAVLGRPFKYNIIKKGGNEIWRYETIESPANVYNETPICEGAFFEFHFNKNIMEKAVFNYHYYNLYLLLAGRDNFRGHKFHEKYRLRNFTNKITSGEFGISIKLNNNKIKYFKNVKDYGEPYCSYTFGGFLEKINYYVVLVTYFEGFEYIMVNADNGREYKIPAPPRISPDLKRLVSVSADVAYNFNGIQVWQINKNSLKKDWEEESAALYTFRGWDGPLKFQVSAPEQIENSDKTFKNVINYYIVKKSGKRWVIEKEKNIENNEQM